MTSKDSHVKFDMSNLRQRTAFFYGTLMAPEVLNRVVYGTSTLPVHEPVRFRTFPAILPNYRRHRVKDVDYPGIIPVEGSSVRGTYVTGLITSDIAQLDHFEGDQYERQLVNIRLLKAEGDAATGEGNVEGEEVEAETYVWIAGRDALEDQEWDFETFQKGDMRRWVSEEYDMLKAEEEEKKHAELKSAYLAEIEASLRAQAKKDEHKKQQEDELLKRAV